MELQDLCDGGEDDLDVPEADDGSVGVQSCREGLQVNLQRRHVFSFTDNSSQEGGRRTFTTALSLPTYTRSLWCSSLAMTPLQSKTV